MRGYLLQGFGRIARSRITIAVASSLLTSMVAMSAGAYAANVNAASTHVIKAAYNKTTGAMRLLTKSRPKVNKSEVAITWNQKGIQGAAGPKGDRGDTGTVDTTIADRVTALEANVASLGANPVLDLAPFVSVTTTSAADGVNGPNVWFTGANVHVVSGSGATDDGGTMTGLGNLVIGYDALRGAGDVRTGSHNLVLGDNNSFGSFGGLVAGSWNSVSGVYGSVSGGEYNQASGGFSSISGGAYNTASGPDSSVGGGIYNTASGSGSSVSGGNAVTVSSGLGWSAGGTFHNP